ncbi:MAG: 4'-phosphopantetheinyl transferase superfamily protein [Kurthia sp.]|nr:4'-phosphopantetheinyl transferase superfamily protein [Candidatus Kurthia equi]
MMPNSEAIKREIHLFALPIGPQLLQWEWRAFLIKLPHEEQNRILKYKHWQDRQRALLGSALVRWTIRTFTNLQHIQIARDKTGRPYLVGENHWKGDFNLSHSGEWIVMAMTNDGHVGVDVEKIAHFNEEVMAYVMSEAEINLINEKSKQNRINSFYELWTKKEAIYKTGLFSDVIAKSLDTVELTSKHKDVHTQLFYVDSEHPISVCWDQVLPAVTPLIILNRNQLVY